MALALDPTRPKREVATVAAAYFVGHTLTMKRAAITQVSPPATEVPRKTGDATTTGPNSPAVTGDGNKIDYNQPPPSQEDKPKPPK
jgi:hypothetical protein